jgi:hypothetical protein
MIIFRLILKLKEPWAYQENKKSVRKLPMPESVSEQVR